MLTSIPYSQGHSGFLQSKHWFGIALFLAIFSEVMAASPAPPAFAARTLAEALSAYGTTQPTPDPRVNILAEDYVERGENVRFVIYSMEPQTQELAVFAANNRFPLAAKVKFMNGALPAVALQLKLAESTDIIALASTKDQRVLSSKKPIKITIGGCAGSPTNPVRATTLAPEPMKIKTVSVDGVSEIRVLIPHPMETGLRKHPEKDTLIPAHYIQTLTVSANQKTVIEAELNTSIARNPLLAFRVRDLKIGDPIRIHWKDNLGTERTDEATVSE